MGTRVEPLISKGIKNIEAREVWHLHKECGRSLASIASQLGITPKAAKARYEAGDKELTDDWDADFKRRNGCENPYRHVGERGRGYLKAKPVSVNFKTCLKCGGRFVSEGQAICDRCNRTDAYREDRYDNGGEIKTRSTGLRIHDPNGNQMTRLNLTDRRAICFI